MSSPNPPPGLSSDSENYLQMLRRLEKRDVFIDTFKKQHMYQYVREKMKTIDCDAVVISPPVTPRAAVCNPKSVREKETFQWKKKIMLLYEVFTTPLKLDFARDVYI